MHTPPFPNDIKPIMKEKSPQLNELGLTRLDVAKDMGDLPIKMWKQVIKDTSENVEKHEGGVRE